MQNQKTHLPQIHQDTHLIHVTGLNNQRLLTKKLKNHSSTNLIFDYQRRHKIELKALSIIKSHFQKIPKRIIESQNPTITQNLYTFDKLNFQKIEENKFRSHSLPIKNQSEITQNAQKNRQNNLRSKQNLKLHNIEKKLNKAKIASVHLTQTIQAQQQKLEIEKMSDLNCMGNQWILNTFDPVKSKWRKINKTEARQARAGQSLDFYIRKMTSDYEFEKNRINSRIKGLQEQKLKRSESDSNIFNSRLNQLQNLRNQQSQKENQTKKHNNLFKNFKLQNRKSKQNLKILRDLDNFNIKQKSFSKQKIENKKITEQRQKDKKCSQFQQFRTNKSPFYHRSAKLQSKSSQSTCYTDKNKIIENKNRKKLYL